MPASGSLRICAQLLVLVLLFLASHADPAQETQAPAQKTNPSAPVTPAPEPQESPSPQEPTGQESPPGKAVTQEEKPVQRPPSADPKQDAWTILTGAIDSDKTGERAAAIRALGLLSNNPRALSMAEKALKDEKAEVRTSAALALGEMRAAHSIPGLREALGDAEPSVALAAGQALTQMDDASGYDVYYEVLTGERKARKGLLASQESILKDPKKLAGLGIAQGVGFIPFGGFGWEAFKLLVKDDVSPVRASAARMLAKDPDPASLKALEDAAGDKNWLVRTAALEALARRGDPAALATVELFMYDEKNVVQYTASAAYLNLSQLKERQVTPKRKARRKSVRSK
jgi:hypothetical protein